LCQILSENLVFNRFSHFTLRFTRVFGGLSRSRYAYFA
jgi:hypothetical protein